MPYVVSNVFLDTTVMSAADITANFDAGWRYLNGLVATADVVADSVRPHHIKRPEFYGWPIQEGRFVTQQTWSRGGGDFQRNPYNSPDRVDIWPSIIPEGSSFPIHGLMATVHFDHDGRMRVEATFNHYPVMACIDQATLSTAAIDQGSGYYMLVMRERATGTTTDLVRRSSVHHEGSFFYGSHVEMHSSTPVSRGTYDVWVEYRLGAAHANTIQIGILGQSLNIELQRI